MAFFGGLSSCDSGNLPDPGPTPPIDSTKMFANLTPTDKQDLCEWSAGRFGGWSRRVTCTDGETLTGPVSESICEQQQSTTSATCTETVADVVDCINQVVDGCQAIPDVCFNLLFDCGMLTM